MAETLHGLRVLDLGNRAASAWCSRLLADFGAQVIMAESAQGHPLRSHPPFADDGVSIAAKYFLANKHSVHADAADALIEAAQVIITTTLPGDDLDAAQLQQRNPQALICALTAHGQSGARTRQPGNDLTANALSGWASVNGIAGRTPLKASGYQASYQAGTFAFGCVVSALIEQLAQGSPGQVIDIAELEVLVSTFAPAPLRYQYSGFVWPRKQALDVNEGPVPVADGYFALTISRPVFWIKAMQVLGLPELAADKELQQAGLRPKLKHRFADTLSTAMAGWKRMELFNALGRERVIAGPVLRMDEMADNPQFAARGFFRRAPSGIRFPGPFAHMSASDWQLRRELGAIGADAAAFTRTPEIRSHPVRSGDLEQANRGPLQGFRGLVLTQAWAGTYATELLALLGAEVMQLEVRGRLDSWRGTYQNPIPKQLSDRATAQHAWNVNPLYNSVNLNKQCITLDLNTEVGVAMFKDLVAQVDFVAENFSPRVMAKLGIDYPVLRQLRPDLVMASLSAYGATGPWAGVPGIGGTIEPSSGMSALLGYEGEHPLNSGQMYPDPVAGLCGFAALALALLQRDRSGEGQYIDLSMQEASFTFIGDAWLEYECTGRVRGTQGNFHPLFAPHGIYPAKGADQWLALAAQDDAQWQQIAEVLGLDAAAWATASVRAAARTALDELIATRTRAFDKTTLAALLCQRGVPAAPVLDAAEVASDQALRERGHMVEVNHPEAGRMWQSGLSAIFSRTPGGVVTPAPLQGQHSFEVFARLLGMDNRTYSRLCEEEVTGTGPVSASSVENQA